MQKVKKYRVRWEHNFFCQYYVATMDAEIDHFVIQEEEVHDIRWFSVEEVRKGSYKWNPIADHLVENLDYFVSL